MTDFAHRTHPEVAEILGPETVALQPVGALEAHGPHLPLDTDTTVAQAIAERTADQLAVVGVRALTLPPIAFGVSRLADRFDGWIALRPGTLWAILEDVIESLTEQGVRRIVLVNGHLEREHIKVLDGVILDHPRVTKREAQVIHPDWTRPDVISLAGEEMAKGDFHAGRFETSVILAADSASVRRTLARGLPPLNLDLAGRVAAGARGLGEAGATEAYCGDPAAASAGEGRARLEALAAFMVRSVRAAWPELGA